MTVDPLIQSLKGKLVVSVQAYMGEPLRTPETMAQMSRACELGGAAAIRCQGLADIAAIKGRCEVPVIGLWKDGHEGVYITPTLRHARACVAAGADIVAIDATDRPRPDGKTVEDTFRPLHEEGVLLMADCATIEDIRRAVDMGFDLVSTTLSHGVAAIDCTMADGPDLPLLRQATEEFPGLPIICEGRVHTPEEARAAIDAGATTVNIPDTVGYTVPEEFGGIITTLFNRVPNIDRAIISVHCHNDLGMATANSITAIQHGARQIECCMNGLGERAGNCSLEEVAMAIKLREKSLGGLYTGINPKQIARTSGLVSKICSEPVPAHKAIVGSNAFAHSSGIHQDGVLKNRETYEILTPESVGFTGNTMRMTARSGRHMIRASLANMGYKDDEYDLNEIYARFLKLADKKGQVFDYDLEALLFCSTLEEEENTFELDALSVMTGGSHSIPTASVRLRVGKRTRSDSSIGNGPVDAVYNCITRLTGIRCELTSFTISANGAGMDALGQVDVNVRHEGRIFHGTVQV